MSWVRLEPSQTSLSKGLFFVVVNFKIWLISVLLWAINALVQKYCNCQINAINTIFKSGHSSPTNGICGFGIKEFIFVLGYHNWWCDIVLVLSVCPIVVWSFMTMWRLVIKLTTKGVSPVLPEKNTVRT